MKVCPEFQLTFYLVNLKLIGSSAVNKEGFAVWTPLNLCCVVKGDVCTDAFVLLVREVLGEPDQNRPVIGTASQQLAVLTTRNQINNCFRKLLCINKCNVK